MVAQVPAQPLLPVSADDGKTADFACLLFPSAADQSASADLVDGQFPHLNVLLRRADLFPTASADYHRYRERPSTRDHSQEGTGRRGTTGSLSRTVVENYFWMDD